MTLDDIINSGDPREIKRALAVKMFEHGADRQYISMILTVSESYVSKWNSIYRKSGAEGLLLGYIGSEGYLDEFDRYDIINSSFGVQNDSAICPQALSGLASSSRVNESICKACVKKAFMRCSSAAINRSAKSPNSVRNSSTVSLIRQRNIAHKR